MPMTACSSWNIASVIPFFRADAECDAMRHQQLFLLHRIAHGVRAEKRNDRRDVPRAASGHRHGQRNQQDGDWLPGRNRRTVQASAKRLTWIPPRKPVPVATSVSQVVRRYYSSGAWQSRTMDRFGGLYCAARGATKHLRK